MVVPRKIELQPAPKGYTDAQDKAAPPRATVARALERLEGLAGLGDVELCPRHNAVHGAWSITSASAGFNTSGKGLTEEQAQASAVMEFVERYGWLNFDYESYPGYAWASHRVMREEGYAVPDASYFVRNFIKIADPEALLAEICEVPLKWVASTRLEDQSALYYPINWHNMLFTSNGLASGNTLEETILQAICELIERENVYRLFVERRPGIAVAPESIHHPLITRVLENGREAGIEFLIRDISSDLGVPTFIVRGTRAAEEGKLTYRGVGQGCHPDPEKALIRAISEYFEGLSTMETAQASSGLNLGSLWPLFPKRHYGFHTFYNAEMLEASSGAERLSEVLSLARPDMKEELDLCLGILRAKELDVAVIDKTRPDLGIPTVRVFAPAMRSCISTEFYGAPSLALSAVYYEAGNEFASKHHAGNAFEKDPAWDVITTLPLVGPMLPLLARTVNPSRVFGGDYRESLVRMGKTKKSGLDQIQKLEEVSTLLGPTLGLFSGPQA